MSSLIRVLAVEDNPADVEYARRSLEPYAEFSFDYSGRLTEGIEQFQRHGADVVLLDLTLPESNGKETFSEFKRQCPNVAIVVYTGTNDVNTAKSLIKSGAQDYMVKGDVRGPEIVRILRYAVERVNANKALAEKARQLARSNRELVEFASIASHDLQEPLRKVQAFGDRLVIKLGGSMMPDVKDCLDRMQSATGRMRALIDDLLDYSHVTTQGKPFVEVDLNEIVKNAVSDLEVRLKDTEGRVLFAPLPTIYADHLQMHQLFLNLIGNALKFNVKGRPPEVTIESTIKTEQLPSSDSIGPVCKISFKDNGIGFDEKYLDRIFNIFQRLHGRSEYEGTGIGLALCRKIVSRHEGSISATSKIDEGATFTIRLPANQENPETYHEA